MSLSPTVILNFFFHLFFSVGHGRSEGERAQIQDFSHYVRDVFTHIDQVAAENTGIPIFMFGHSMVSTRSLIH